MKIDLYTRFIDTDSAFAASPRLASLVSRRGIELTCVEWDGSIESLSTQPCMVQAYDAMRCSIEDLGRRCEDFSHFCFCDDKVIMEDGTTEAFMLLFDFDRFLYWFQRQNRKKEMKT